MPDLYSVRRYLSLNIGLSVLLLLPATFITPIQAQSSSNLNFVRTDLKVQGLGPRGILAKDLNGDEIPDLVVANLGTYLLYQSQTLDVFFGKGDGTFTLAQSLPVGDGNQPYGMASADLRGIERLDVIVPNKDGKTVSIFLAKEDGTFEEPKAIAANDAWAVSAGDINGDGIPDLAVANFDSYAITILIGIGDGNFLPPFVIPATQGMQPRAVEFGDFNNDGRTDLVVPSDTANGRVAIFQNTGTKDSPSFAAPRVINVGQLTGAAVVYDLNNDGKMDIATSSAYSNNIAIVFGNGDGSFASPVSYWTGDIWPFGMTLTDFNGDGNPDLVLAGVKGVTCGVLLGDGRGVFSSPYHFQIQGPSRWNAAADFNLDGKMDIAAGNYTVTGSFESEPSKFFNTVSIMLNRTNFQQQRPAAFRVNCGGSALTTARGVSFSADGNFDGGAVITTDAPIEGAENQQLYQSARQGNFTYTARVAPGRPYTVKLFFAEQSAKVGKKRTFTISLNGKTVIKNFNLLKRTQPNRAYKIVRHNVWADQSGQIRLEFSGKKGGAICSGISIF